MKNLIVYYSYTGNTKKVASKLAEMTQGKLCPLVLKEDYTKNYDALVNELENNNTEDNQPELQALEVSLNNFDRIFVLSPVWWYTMSCPVNTFLHQNHLEGKEVYLFATNAGWLGHTFEDMKKLLKDQVKGCFDCVFEGKTWQNEEEILKELQKLEHV